MPPRPDSAEIRMDIRDTTALSSTLGRRFHTPPTPSVVALSHSTHPITFSLVASDAALPEPTLAPPVEQAFAVHVHHAPLARGGHIWIEGRHRPMPPVPVGRVFIFDLRTDPAALTFEPFEFSRIHISRASMDELAFESGITR